MGWLSNARRHEQLLSPGAARPTAKSRVSSAGVTMRTYDDGANDVLSSRTARPTERATRDAKPAPVLHDSPFDVPGPMFSPDGGGKKRAPMKPASVKPEPVRPTKKTSLEDENASLREALARVEEDLMAERARADALASRLEQLETTDSVIPPGVTRTRSMPLEAHNGHRNPFGTPPRARGANVVGKDAARALFNGGDDVNAGSPGGLHHHARGMSAKENNNVHTPERSRREQHSYDPFLRSGGTRVVKVPSPTGGKMIQIRAQ